MAFIWFTKQMDREPDARSYSGIAFVADEATDTSALEMMLTPIAVARKVLPNGAK